MKKNALSKVFGWMFVGLFITFVSAYIVSLNTNMLQNIYSGGTYWLFLVAEILIAVFLSVRITKMSGGLATFLYLVYTFLTGVTFSIIFVAYEMGSIIAIFLITALLFGIFALIGKYTKFDLSRISTYLFMGLLGIIILSFINYFVLNDTLNMIGCILGIVVFLGYTAYDIQKILKNDDYDIEDRNFAIIGAFSLYLDFINIFIDLLNLFGDSGD